MAEDFERALGYFDRATSLYQTIGDRISYAYTRWGEGTTFKMVGKEEEALEAFQAAEVIFRATEDRRGMIYTLLGRGELALLGGAVTEAEGLLGEAVGIAEACPFQLELCHCHLLQLLFRRESGETISFDEVRKEYRHVGSDFSQREIALPLNLP
jgi:tetratricopeptide (TPR) repeat protein